MKWLLVIKMKQTPCKQCQTHTAHTMISTVLLLNQWQTWKAGEIKWKSDVIQTHCDACSIVFFEYIFDVLSFLSWKSNGLHNQFIIISCIEMYAMRKCNSLYWNCKIDFNAYTWAHRQRCIFKRVSILFLAPDLLLWSAPIYRSN